MRILYIQDLLGFGGINRITACKENYLVERGYEVYNLCMADNKDVVSNYSYDKRINCVSLYADIYKRFYNIPYVGRLIRFIMFRVDFLKVLMKVRPNLIITTRDYIEPFTVIIFTFWIKRILEFHGGLIDDDIRKKSFKEKCRIKYKYFFYHLVTLTEEDKIKRERICRHKFMVIPNPLHLSSILKSDLKSKKIISLGRYHNQKGYDLLIPAWKEIADKYPDWCLELYGQGEEESNLNHLIKKNGLEEKVILNPPVKDVTEVLLNSSIFIMSSRYEGFPLVLLEAMICGVPCVSVSCPCGPSEIIIDGKDGFLVDHLDMRMLVSKVECLIEDKARRKEMGNQAAININRFSIDIIMTRWMNLFNIIQNESITTFNFNNYNKFE